MRGRELIRTREDDGEFVSDRVEGKQLTSAH